MLTALNYDRIAYSLVSEPKFEKYKFAMLALLRNCTEVNKYLSPAQRLASMQSIGRQGPPSWLVCNTFLKFRE